MKSLAEFFKTEIGDIELSLAEHLAEIDKFNKANNYIEGEQDIDSRIKPSYTANNKYKSSYAKNIRDFATNYFIGTPLTFEYDADFEYQPSLLESIKTALGVKKNIEKQQQALLEFEEEAVQHINSLYKKSHYHQHDYELGSIISTCGVGLELLYIKGNPDPKTDSLDLRVKLKAIKPYDGNNNSGAFLVRKNDIGRTVVGGVYYYPYFKDNEKSIRVMLYSDTEIGTYNTTENLSKTSVFTFDSKESHYFGSVPLIEYVNNAERVGDFYDVIGIIDSYNTLMSDRINDKQEFVDSILVISGGNIKEGWAKELKKDRLLNIPESSTIQWLTKQLQEEGVQVLADQVIDDIHKFAMIPDINDEAFAGNASGVAMKYKLIGLDIITKSKELNFTKGLLLRFKRIFNIDRIRSKGNFNYESVVINYNHTLPTDEREVVDMALAKLQLISKSTALSELGYDNPQSELDKRNLELEEDNKRNFMTTPPSVDSFLNDTEATEEDVKGNEEQ